MFTLNLIIRYKYILEQKTDFLSHFRLTSTKHHIKYGCLGNKERLIFHIFILKNFLFISKKITKRQEKIFCCLELSAKSHNGGGGGGNTSYPSPNGVNFGTSPNHPKWKLPSPKPHITRFILYSYAMTFKFF